MMKGDDDASGTYVGVVKKTIKNRYTYLKKTNKIRICVFIVNKKASIDWNSINLYKNEVKR
jgi:hypothetical protein